MKIGDIQTFDEYFGNQYKYFKEKVDLNVLPTLMEEFEINIFFDSDHAHDSRTGLSVKGIMGFVGITPVITT